MRYLTRAASLASISVLHFPKETRAAFNNALYLGRWDTSFAKLLSETEAAFAAYRPDASGAFRGEPEVANGGAWELLANTFYYDARLDPCALAEDLNAYIAGLKAETGSETVRIAAQGFGCCVAAAYFAAYCWADVDAFVMLGSAAMGSAFVGEAFSGAFCVDDAAVTAFVRQESRFSEPLSALLTESVFNAHERGILNAGELLSAGLLASETVPAVLRASYALCPGVWALVDDAHYEAAKAYLLGDAAAYAALIAAIDAYHYNVQNKLPQMLLSMREDGVSVYDIAAYGVALPPLTQSFAAPADGLVPFYQQSCAAEAVASDDFVPAAHFLLPDSTWCIKGLAAYDLPAALSDFVLTLAQSETQLTVNSDAAYPRLLTYSAADGTLSAPAAPLPEEPGSFIVRMFREFRNAVRVWFVYVRSFLLSHLSGLTEKDLS